MRSSHLKRWSTFGNLGLLYDTLQNLCLRVGDSFAQYLMSSSIRSIRRRSKTTCTHIKGITRRTNSLNYWSRGFESKKDTAKSQSRPRRFVEGPKGGF
jgi:hypothetical protein